MKSHRCESDGLNFDAERGWARAGQGLKRLSDSRNPTHLSLTRNYALVFVSSHNSWLPWHKTKYLREFGLGPKYRNNIFCERPHISETFVWNLKLYIYFTHFNKCELNLWRWKWVDNTGSTSRVWYHEKMWCENVMWSWELRNESRFSVDVDKLVDSIVPGCFNVDMFGAFGEWT